MGDNPAEKELKGIISTHTNKKKTPISLFIKIREAKDIVDLKIREKDQGITEIRVHSTNDKFPKWYLHGYLINIKNLRLDLDKLKKKEIVQKVLRDPSILGTGPTQKLLEKLDRDFGGIVPFKPKKLFWQTEKFKKHKDPYKVKMKTLN